jgi:hypothetical protein
VAHPEALRWAWHAARRIQLRNRSYPTPQPSPCSCAESSSIFAPKRTIARPSKTQGRATQAIQSSIHPGRANPTACSQLGQLQHGPLGSTRQSTAERAGTCRCPNLRRAWTPVRSQSIGRENRESHWTGPHRPATQPTTQSLETDEMPPVPGCRWRGWWCKAQRP